LFTRSCQAGVHPLGTGPAAGSSFDASSGGAELHEAIGPAGRDIDQREQVEIRAAQIGQHVFGHDIRARPLAGAAGLPGSP
jgi:hypothetical protein